MTHVVTIVHIRKIKMTALHPLPFETTTENPPLEQMGVGAKILVFLYLIVAIAYLAWRASTLNPDAPVFSAMIYGAELFGFATTLLHLFMVWRLTVRITSPPVPGLTVDVFIPTYNESVDLLRRTLLAARNIDYPHATWLLDDGNRPEMAALAQDLGVHYLARTDNEHAKAGNLNNALRHSTAEFVAVFDADHAPKRNFIDETLGFFRDPGLAFVQTPQDFFNLDSFQHRTDKARVWTEQSLFFRVIQRGKDAWNAAFFCGSCALIRRSALDKIGGFATSTVTEDLETSVALHKAGFRSVYIPEPLAFGVAPASADPFLKQRIRWGQGAMQVVRKEWLFLRGGLSLPQRLNYLASALTYFDGWQKAIFYLAPVWVLLSGTMPLVADAQTFLVIFVPYFLLTFLVFEEVGRGYGRSALIEQYNMARFAAFIWATFGLLRRNLRFKVTAKQSLTAKQAETWMMSPQIFVAALNLIAIVAGALLWQYRHHLPWHGLVANMVWAAVNFTMAFLVIRFTLLRTRFRRRDYRFPVPLPARINFGPDAGIMIVDDISPSGCRIYGRFPNTAKVDDLVYGELLLPGDPLPFTGKVAALIPGGNDEESWVKSLGVEFQWADAADRNRLELFLFGSDLQWQINRINERTLTPTERFQAGPRTSDKPLRPEAWAAIEIGSSQNSTDAGLITAAQGDSGSRVLVSYSRIDGKEQLEVREHTRSGARHHVLRPVRLIAHIGTPTGSLYLTEMEKC
ncbi:MAG: glycosyltransferase [Lysobacter sp.]